jgi:ketosteroid isomerase-like protein
MNPRTPILSAAALMFAVVACQQPKAATFTDADRATIRTLFDSTVARISAKSTTAFANEYTENAVLMPTNHPIVRGRAAIKAWADSLPPISNFSFSDVTVDGEGDMAIGTTTYAITFNPPGAPPMPDKGKQLVTFHRQPDGSWLVTDVAFNSDLPLPTAAPAAAASAPTKNKK